MKQHPVEGGGFYMGRWRRRWLLPGLVCIALGAVIILGMILPKAFWWFLLGTALIVLGVWLIRCQ